MVFEPNTARTYLGISYSGSLNGRVFSLKAGEGLKIDRLLGIVTTLLQKGKSTAPELAETIRGIHAHDFRDVEDICKAGIPLVATQGGGGGIADRRRLQAEPQRAHGRRAAEHTRGPQKHRQRIRASPELSGSSRS